MPPRNDLVIPPVVLIGPVAAGKSTVASLLGWPTSAPTSSTGVSCGRLLTR
jgi:cytidylate kinase